VTFTISFSRPLRLLLGALGTGPRRSTVEVRDDVVAVTMGWAFRAAIPTASITGVRRPQRCGISRGVHGWRGRYLVNGSAHGLVSFSVAPAQRARVVGFPVRLRELTVSVDDPVGLVDALAVASPG
jgi:hypothetical protein